ncbi:MAG: FtsX-like permease family protein, partial [Bacteroidetes bacterium]|nr:FtsX-like permease family protein [Bacteroidota bacterium]
LYLKAGDPLRVYFIQEGEAVPRGRKFNIAGIYETGVGELDRLYVIGDIGVIRKLNNWETDQVGGFEILVKDFKKLDKVGKKIYRAVGYELNAKTIRDLYPQIFEWLGLMDMNAIIILVLMVLVSSMTMISTFLIIVLEKTGMIGILKALGARNGRISRLFLIQAGYILTLGLLWGNAVGIGLALIQKKWSVMKLPQDSYYVSVVPINLDWLSIAGLNLGTLIVCTAMMIIPSFIINRISPIKAIRFQ